MPTALIDSPQHSETQLFFNWPDTPPSSAHSLNTPPVARVPYASRTTSVLRHRSGRASAQPTARRVQPSVPERGAGEVRLGSVMIELLKRYGITDEEIAEGLANYAKKRCQAGPIGSPIS